MYISTYILLQGSLRRWIHFDNLEGGLCAHAYTHSDHCFESRSDISTLIDKYILLFGLPLQFYTVYGRMHQFPARDNRDNVAVSMRMVPTGLCRAETELRLQMFMISGPPHLRDQQASSCSRCPLAEQESYTT